MVLHPSDERNQLEKKLAQAEQLLRERQIQEDQLVQQYNALQVQYSHLKELGVGNGHVSKNLSVSFREPLEKQLEDPLSKDKRSTAQLALRRDNERLKAELEQCKQQQTAKPAKCIVSELPLSLSSTTEAFSRSSQTGFGNHQITTSRSGTKE
jgi:hypothetical protein